MNARLNRGLCFLSFFPFRRIRWHSGGVRSVRNYAATVFAVRRRRRRRSHSAAVIISDRERERESEGGRETGVSHAISAFNDGACNERKRERNEEGSGRAGEILSRRHTSAPLSDRNTFFEFVVDLH